MRSGSSCNMRLIDTMNPSSTKSGVFGRLETLSSNKSMLLSDAVVPRFWSPRIRNSGCALGSEPRVLLSNTLKLGS